MPPKIHLEGYKGLTKVISGGQTGVDRAGLDAAKRCGFATGGTAPKGWRTCWGSDVTLQTVHGLKEHFSPDYPKRTAMNILESDATLILARSFTEPGTSLTMATCKRVGKMFLAVRIPIQPENLALESKKIVEFIHNNQIQVLNVAGNRDKIPNTYTNYDSAMAVLEDVFNQIQCFEGMNQMIESRVNPEEINN